MSTCECDPSYITTAPCLDSLCTGYHALIVAMHVPLLPWTLVALRRAVNLRSQRNLALRTRGDNNDTLHVAAVTLVACASVFRLMRAVMVLAGFTPPILMYPLQVLPILTAVYAQAVAGVIWHHVWLMLHGVKQSISTDRMLHLRRRNGAIVLYSTGGMCGVSFMCYVYAGALPTSPLGQTLITRVSPGLVALWAVLFIVLAFRYLRRVRSIIADSGLEESRANRALHKMNRVLRASAIVLLTLIISIAVGTAFYFRGKTEHFLVLNTLWRMLEVGGVLEILLYFAQSKVNSSKDDDDGPQRVVIVKDMPDAA